MNTSTKKPGGLGCFGYGCCIATVLLTVIGGGVGYYTVNSLRSAVLTYSTDAALPLTVSATPSDIYARSREKFSRLIEASPASIPLREVFSSEELLSLKNATAWRDKVDFVLIGNSIKASFSFPLSAVGEWTAARLILGSTLDRFVSGNLSATAGLRDGKVSLSITELNLNGQGLEDLARGHASEWLTGAITSAMNQEGDSSPLSAWVRSIDSIEVEDGNLVVERKPRSP